MDFYGFYTGKIFDAYKYLGAHVDLAWSFAQAVPLSFVTCQNTNSKTASGCKVAATAEKNR